MGDMDSTLLRRCVVGLAVATLVPLVILTTAAALGQTNTQTIQRTLGNMQSLPLASEPYQRSTDDYLYRQQLRDSEAGLLAAAEPDWREALRTLAADHELRHRLGARGRDYCSRHYALERWAPVLNEILHTVAAGRP